MNADVQQGEGLLVEFIRRTNDRSSPRWLRSTDGLRWLRTRQQQQQQQP